MPGPLYHNGPFVTVFPALMIGAPVVIMPKFDAEETLRLIAKHSATWIYLVPTMMGRIWRLPEEVRNTYDVSSLKTLWHLAAPCPAWLKEEWIAWLGADVIGNSMAARKVGAHDHHGHGMAGAQRLGRPRLRGRRDESLRRPRHDLPAAKPARSSCAARRTCRRPIAMWAPKRARLPGGWESIGDIGWFDEDGYLYLADRRTDMILVGGANVYPAEVEAAIDEHPLVQSSCVIGLPDDDLGNRVHAIVQPRGELTSAELETHLAERLVIYKRPRSFEFVSDPLRDDAGKVRRSALREERMKKNMSSPPRAYVREDFA